MKVTHLHQLSNKNPGWQDAFGGWVANEHAGFFWLRMCPKWRSSQWFRSHASVADALAGPMKADAIEARQLNPEDN
ncbi:hypothetical protein PXNS11_510013 [Stutzerimonas xanthomarina]|nr:hypothetical protein PXNS11_510013 [Stutzerimonas xanthomarina]